MRPLPFVRVIATDEEPYFAEVIGWDRGVLTVRRDDTGRIEYVARNMTTPADYPQEAP